MTTASLSPGSAPRQTPWSPDVRPNLLFYAEKIRALPEITAVFLNVERMAPPTKVRGSLRGRTEEAPGSIADAISAAPFTRDTAADALTPSLRFQKELEAAWGVQVFDRFTVVLSIFRCNARTKEARLQVALAELPLLRFGARPSSRGSPSRMSDPLPGVQ